MGRLIKVTSGNTVLVPLIAILLGLLTGAVVMLIGGYNPIVAYAALLERVFGNIYDFGETIRQITPLILTGLSVAFAFRTGLFNIGAEGQFILGMTGATLIGDQVSLPAYIHLPLAIIVGALLGGFWGAIAGWLKAKRGVNEVISTIMLNWIALYLGNYIVKAFLLEPGMQDSRIIKSTAILSVDWLTNLFDGARVHWGILIALLAAYAFYLILWKTKQGFELRAVGLNPYAAEYAGMNVGRNIMKAMFIGGVFAGLAGAFEILGVFHYQSIASAFPGYGLDGIAVSLLGMNSPLGVVLAACLFGVLTYGSAGMSFAADVPPELIRVVIGAIIFFIAAQAIVRLIIAPFYAKRNKAQGGS
ncbi:ABC transporter permease [Paenibacillus albiflavus]|uniref:ABC transporter permease n=1 Tax=Paenibacillus albiflavus TaxID=2545760 RepID=A0A4R4EFN8_9BACL|nr:ABC transporter permease [Paenibacillus albiflavus]TCZ78874.1 ABC transporter permease [Paenibacillus albiflavus]